MREEKKEFWKETLIDYTFLIIACFIGAFASTAIMIPNGLTSGGLTGIIRILQYFVDVNFSVAYYVGALLVLIIVIITIGFREAKKILVLSVMYPAALIITEMTKFQLLEEKDIILAVIFFGVLSGVCNGIVFWRGYSFCGTESIAKILKKKVAPQVDISKLLLMQDTVVIIASALVYGRNIALYALVTMFISAKMIDLVMYGFETKIVEVNIITNIPDEVAQYVMEDLDRGVSSKTMVGEYTKQEKKQLVVLCSPRESMLIKKYLAHHDPTAFVTILHVDTVWGAGKGFTSIHD